MSNTSLHSLPTVSQGFVRRTRLPIRQLLPLVGLCLPVVAQAGQWVRGDLHIHSTHSDGTGTVADILSIAEDRGLNYIAITDHDSNMSGNPTTWSDPDYQSDSTVLLYGVEWTTGKGHANVWSDELYDYSELWQANLQRDVTHAIDAAHDQGALFSVNHPSSYACCPWEYGSLETVDGIEVWNGTFRLPSFNHITVESLWDDLLLRGYRPSGVGGSDAHYIVGPGAELFNVGNPTTWVTVEEVSAAGILDGLAAGHVSISYAPDGERVILTADTDQDGVDDADMGDEIGYDKLVQYRVRVETPTGKAARQTRLKHVSPAVVRSSFQGPIPLFEMTRAQAKGLGAIEGRLLVIIKDGEVVDSVILRGTTGEYTWTDTPAAGSYTRVELIGMPAEFDGKQRITYGWTLGVSNPILAW